MGFAVNNTHSIEDNDSRHTKQKIDVLTLVYMVLVQSVASHQDTMVSEAARLEGNANVQKSLTARLDNMNVDLLTLKKLREHDPGKGFGRFITALGGLFGHANPKYGFYKTVDNQGDLNLHMMQNARTEKNRGITEGQLSSIQQTANIDSTGIDMQAKAASQMMQESLDNCSTQRDLTTKANLTKT